jgi:Ca2+/Na+ antiporter
MTKRNLQQIDKQVKSQHKYWESLSPEDRRASVIQMRDAQSKNAQKSIVFLAIIGFLFSAATIHFWLNEYHLSLESSLGVIGGVVLAALGFQYIKSNRIKSNSKIQSNDFSDDDIIAYFQEHEKVNQRALKQWNKNKYLVFVLGGLFILSLNLRLTKDFSFMALVSGISIFLIGLVVFFTIQKGKNR